ncbi:Peptidase cysteine/serine, trypsin-like protein [Moelleriella libera RCEF 2490]|uniref:Peptidase cysteine/serine, trypsin-like protein n=1 Tax=Moelleriella libera RCEF 2490 TaxID=1081109 RepID=A0A167YUF6_9HYPO|nr:Peptidase cysteine/serine, trypsin-like protein [Moelleriella libera RCEF 2490]
MRKAICKLFLNYIGQTDDEYIGTGWLIGPSLIVTVGHCAIEEQAALNYIKVYLGYAGPQSVNTNNCTVRHGVRMAMPAEYLKAEAATHDVSFIELDELVNNIKPIEYVSTPATKTTASLGVVGYPGDLDHGFFMYEEWVSETIRLNQTRGLLSYKIDTNGGQSGSPVLINNASTAVGVHVEGGYPNRGSVIAPAGNKFGEYILALEVVAGHQSVHAVKLNTTAGKNLAAPGFSLVRIEPGALKENARALSGELSKTGDASASEQTVEGGSSEEEGGINNLNLSKPLATKPEENRYVLEKQLDHFLGRQPQMGLKEFQGPHVMRFPQSLIFKETTDATTAAAPTTFFVGLPPGNLSVEDTKVLKENVDLVQSWQAWSSSACEDVVQRSIRMGQLPADALGQTARSNYRAKVFDYLFKNSPWFGKIFDQNRTKRIVAKKVDFHTAILTAVLQTFSVPFSVLTQLESIWKTIGDNLSRKSAKYSQFHQFQAVFISWIYKEVQATVDRKLIDAGLALVSQRSLEIPI